MNRAEHLAWCKARALAYCDAGETANAFASMISDLGKHDETRGHPGIELGALLPDGWTLKNGASNARVH